MPAFLKDIAPFYGTGEQNEKGQDLESFLEEYDTKKYDNPSVTADILVIKHDKDIQTVNTGLKILMVKRRNHPSIGYWALPGGFININEDIEMAAKRELLEETSVKDIAIEQIYTWGEHWRDPRARIVTVSYLALIDEDIEVQAGDDAADAAWFDIQFKKCEERLLKKAAVNGNDKIRVEEYYEITLISREKGITLPATIIRSYNQDGLLKEENYSVISSEGIAFDHSRFIGQALIYIHKLLSR
jgi:8-oxo-dGTP diphosphatase